MSLRAHPDHHQLIRDIGLALRTRPELEAVLRDVLQEQHDGIAPGNTDVLHAFQERLMIQSESLRTTMAYADNINERLKVLEQPEALRDTDGNTGVLQSILDRLTALEEMAAGAPATMTKRAPTWIPRRMPEGRNAILREHVEEAAKLWQEGKSFRQIRDEKGWDCNFNALGKKVKQYLENTAGDRPQEDVQDEQETRPHE
jgi:hypothetical protein